MPCETLSTEKAAQKVSSLPLCLPTSLILCIGEVWCIGNPGKPQSGSQYKNVVPFMHSGIKHFKQNYNKEKLEQASKKAVGDVADPNTTLTLTEP